MRAFQELDQSKPLEMIWDHYRKQSGGDKRLHRITHALSTARTRIRRDGLWN